jgi:hypothetical protein
MYNLTYTEIFFIDTLWPDFKFEELKIIINKYNNYKKNLWFIKIYLIDYFFLFFFSNLFYCFNNKYLLFILEHLYIYLFFMKF